MSTVNAGFVAASTARSVLAASISFGAATGFGMILSLKILDVFGGIGF